MGNPVGIDLAFPRECCTCPGCYGYRRSQLDPSRKGDRCITPADPAGFRLTINISDALPRGFRISGSGLIDLASRRRALGPRSGYIYQNTAGTRPAQRDKYSGGGEYEMSKKMKYACGNTHCSKCGSDGKCFSLVWSHQQIEDKKPQCGNWKKLK